VRRLASIWQISQIASRSMSGTCDGVRSHRGVGWEVQARSHVQRFDDVIDDLGKRLHAHSRRCTRHLNNTRIPGGALVIWPGTSFQPDHLITCEEKGKMQTTST